jgi:hypothetical protein
MLGFMQVPPNTQEKLGFSRFLVNPRRLARGGRQKETEREREGGRE